MPPIPAPRFQVLLCWLVFAAAVIALAAVSLDTDSAMRLAEVRDLLHGQGWFDTTQYRMNVPFNVPMHWSRLVDAPIALLIRLAGEKIALTVWPLAVFAAVLAALARLASATGNRVAVPIVLLLALLCVFLLALFTPGSIDHHNVQIALMLWTMVFTIERRPRFMALGVALALTVGLEVLPYAIMAILASLFWLRDDTPRARDFGLTLAGVALLLLLGVAARRYQSAPVCDTYSLFHAALLVAGGIGLAGISLLPRHRFAALGVLALLLAALAALVDPACLSGPYGGMDMQLRLVFLARINEARSAWEFATFAPSEFVGGFVYACVLFVGGFFAPPGRARCVLLAFAGAALVTSLWQVRAVPFAIFFALPVFAAALARLWHQRGAVALAVALLLGNQVAFAVAGVAIEGRAQHDARIAAFAAQVACADPDAVGLLNAQPPGRVAAFVDQGPAILAYTKDSVIAGPYHRDVAGILDTYRIFTLPQDQARALLKARGMSYVMVCTAAPDWGFYQAHGHDGLAMVLGSGRPPDWLTPLGTKGDVRLYKLN